MTKVSPGSGIKHDPEVGMLADKLGAKVVAEYPTPSLGLPGRVTPTSLSLPEGMSFEEYEQVVETLLSMLRSVAFWIGDALDYGERRWGDMYTAAIEMTGLEYGTLRNIVSVCHAVEPSRRRDNLSYSHHAAVASLESDDQDRMLDRAEHHGWTHKQLRGAVRRLKADLDPDYEPCRCPRCGHAIECE